MTGQGLSFHSLTAVSFGHSIRKFKCMVYICTYYKSEKLLKERM